MRRADLLAALLVAVLALAFPLTVVFSGKALLPRHSAARDLPWSATARHQQVKNEPLNYTMSDKFNLTAPDFALAHAELKQGHLPLWNPWILGGVPELANPTASVVYPPQILLLQADPLNALALSLGLHLLLAGLFMLAYLRFLKIKAGPALFGAAAFMFSGWMTAHLQNGMVVAVIAWLPLGLASLEGFFRFRSRRYLVPLALAIGMMWLAGFPQYALYGTLGLGLYALPGLLFPNGSRGARWRRGGLVLAFAAAGILLASVQLVPLLEVMPLAGHQGRSAADLVAERYREAGLVGALLPDIMGDPRAPMDWRQDLGARILLADQPSPAGLLPSPAMNWSERTIYPGILVVLLALLGLAQMPDRARCSLLLVALAGYLMATRPLVIRLLQHLPGFDVGAPARAMVLPLLALPVLAAMGLQLLLAREQEPTSRKTSRALWLLVPGLLMAGLWCWMLLVPDGTLRALAAGLKDLGVEERLSPGIQRPVEAYLKPLTPAFLRLRHDLGRLALVLLPAALFLILTRSSKRRWILLPAGLTGLLVGELLSFGLPPNAPVTRQGLFEVTGALAFLQEHLKEGRILRVHRDEAAALAEGDSLFVPNLSMLLHLRDAEGYREQAPRAYRQLWKGVSARVLPFGISGIPANHASSLVVSLARVRYLLAKAPLPKLQGHQVYPPEGQPGELWIYENPRAFPEAYLVRGKPLRLTPAEARRALREELVDPGQRLILVDPHGGSLGPDKSPIPWTTPSGVASLRERAGFLECSFPPGSGDHLVVTNSFFPGWRAYLKSRDGREEEVPVEWAQGAFQAVVLKPDSVGVRMVYAPASFRWGLVLSGLSLLSLILSLLVKPRAGGKRKRPGQSLGVAHA